MSNFVILKHCFFQCRLEEYHDIAMSLCGELKNGKVPLGELIFSCIIIIYISFYLQCLQE